MKEFTFWCDCGRKHTVTLEDDRFRFITDRPQPPPAAVVLGPDGETVWRAYRERWTSWAAAAYALMHEAHDAEMAGVRS